MTTLPATITPTDDDLGNDRWRVEDGKLVISTGLFGDLVLPRTADRDEIERLVTRAQYFASRSIAENTRLAYGVAWRRYVAWMETVFRDEPDPAKRSPLNSNPHIISLHLASLADPPHRQNADGAWEKPKPLARKSIRLALDAIVCAHRWAGLTIDTKDPALQRVFEGILREKATEDEAKAEPILLPMLKKMLAATKEGPADGGVKGVRDRLVLVLGWTTAMRRSEMTTLDIKHIKRVSNGLIFTIKKSKADQMGKGAQVYVERADDPDLDVVRALDEWLLLRDDVAFDSPLFTSLKRNGMPTGKRLDDRNLCRIVSDLALKADPEAVRLAALRGNSFSPHSLRAGLATQASNDQVLLQHTQRHLRHAKPETTALYARESDVTKNSVTRAVFEANRSTSRDE